MTGATSLRVFDGSGNPFGDDGILFISSKLQHNKTLSKIGLRGCGLTAKGSALEQGHLD